MSNGTCSLPWDQLEKWLLKVLVGIFSLTSRYQVPVEWIELLFGRKPWPVGEGMYIFFVPGALTWNLQLLQVIPVYKTEGARSILGAKFGFGGPPFLLAFGRPRFWEAGMEAFFRPGKLQVCQGSSVRENSAFMAGPGKPRYGDAGHQGA